MRTLLARLPVLLAVAGVPAVARADPFDPARVPADARYVVHLDMDAARPTQLWRAAYDRLSMNEAFAAKVGQFETVSSMRFPRDLHDVTVYGRETGDAAAVVILHAKMSREQVLAAVQLAPGYASEIFGTYDLVSWDDDGGRPLFAAFHDGATMIIGRNGDLVKGALDTLDGKTARTAVDAPLAIGGVGRANGGPPTIVYAAALDPSTLAAPGTPANPVVAQVGSACVVLTERPAAPTSRPTTAPASPDAAVRVTLRAKSPEAAQRLLQSAAGLKAMVALGAIGRAADPNLHLAAAVLRSTTLAQTGTAVSADASVGVDQLEKAADRAARPPAGPGKLPTVVPNDKEPDPK